MSNSTQTAIRAQKALKSLLVRFGSWRKVARDLKTELSHTTLSAVAAGKRKPPYKLLEALGVVSKRQPEIIRYRWIGRWVARNGQGFIQ